MSDTPHRAHKLLRIACPSCGNYPQLKEKCKICNGEGTVVRAQVIKVAR